MHRLQRFECCVQRLYKRQKAFLATTLLPFRDLISSLLSRLFSKQTSTGRSLKQPLLRQDISRLRSKQTTTGRALRKDSLIVSLETR